MSRASGLALVIAACGSPDDLDVQPWGEPTLVMMLPGDDPTLTADLLELYIDGDSDEILRATRPDASAPWSLPMAVAELRDPSGLDSTPEVSADGLVLLFASTRIGGAGALDIWMTVRPTRAAPWGPPRVLAELSSPEDDFSPSLSADGLEIVFARPSGGRDLFASRRTSTAAAWAMPEAIDELATPGDDSEPCFTADALGIVFTSNRTGNSDLYLARRDARDEPYTVEPLGPPINTNAPETDPWLSPDRRYLFFMRGSELWRSVR